MTAPCGDARLEEMKLLSEIDRVGQKQVSPPPGPFRDLISFLIQDRLVNDLHALPGTVRYEQAGGLPGESFIERMLQGKYVETLCRVLEGSSVTLRLTHRGRVRLSELKQAVRSGREREPFGISWVVR